MKNFLQCGLLILIIICLTSSIQANQSDFTFYVLSDTHLMTDKDYKNFTVHPYTSSIVSAVIKAKPDFIVHCGDMIQANRHNATIANAEKMWTAFDKDIGVPLRKAGIPIVATPGNHDLYSGIESLYWKYWREVPIKFSLVSGKMSSWHALEYKNCLFVVLDAHTVYLSKEQQEWLKKLLKNSERYRAVFLIGHIGLVGRGRHPKEFLEDSNGGEVIKNIPCEAYFFSGHQHEYFRTKIKRINNIICGASGGESGKEKPSYIKVTVRNNKVTAEHLLLN